MNPKLPYHRALSIRQPWAWLIVHGHKEIENRCWRTDVRGTLLVHASKRMDRHEYELAAQLVSRVNPAIQLPKFEEIERGGIVGEVTITDCVANSDSPWFMGQYGLVLANPKALPFRKYPGKLGFFPVASPWVS